jgi:glutamate synthase (NADPH/NADH)
VPNAHVGAGTDIHDIRANSDAVVLCTGATWPRNLDIDGRGADGIHFAMDYLQVSNTPLPDGNLSGVAAIDETISLRLAEHCIPFGLGASKR